MDRHVPRLLYVCTPGHTRDVFPPAVYERLCANFDVDANPGDRYSSEQVEELIQGADALITGWGAPKVTPAIMEQADSLKLIAHSAGSVLGLLDDVVDTLREREIRVFSARRCIAYNVAEATIGTMIMLSRRWIDHVGNTRGGGWRNAEFTAGRQGLLGATVGLVSASAVGREVIALLAAFRTRVLVYDPYLTDYDAGALGVERVEDIDELFTASDFVSLHAPSIPATQNIVGKRQLDLLRDGAVFLNNSRGSVLDHDALTEAARAGRFQIALDVSTPEPLPADHPLRSMPNVHITPHTAGTGAYGYERIG
ncbi:hydroxyacid dehydrogenase, partial [Candidatus Poribacteria bacterium]|nr:hydroxyacid dehydrogenase [Candidatus Poribacteria bacterium]